MTSHLWSPEECNSELPKQNWPFIDWKWSTESQSTTIILGKEFSPFSTYLNIQSSSQRIRFHSKCPEIRSLLTSWPSKLRSRWLQHPISWKNRFGRSKYRFCQKRQFSSVDPLNQFPIVSLKVLRHLNTFSQKPKYFCRHFFWFLEILYQNCRYFLDRGRKCRQSFVWDGCKGGTGGCIGCGEVHEHCTKSLYSTGGRCKGGQFTRTAKGGNKREIWKYVLIYDYRFCSGRTMRSDWYFWALLPPIINSWKMDIPILRSSKTLPRLHWSSFAKSRR